MRKESNLTQKQLSEKTDINFETIEKIADTCNYDVVFINKKNKNRVLSSKNINREEI